ncbi:AAA family ATPase [Streptomyces sp. UG1]|uniref:AAA family ATPase n=1 Tax=Streptomyces sp. UG1 TaxID=3417652 RepID=UPI003CED87BC
MNQPLCPLSLEALADSYIAAKTDPQKAGIALIAEAHGQRNDFMAMAQDAARREAALRESSIRREIERLDSLDEVRRRRRAEKTAKLRSAELSEEDEERLTQMLAGLYDTYRLDELEKPVWLVDGIVQKGKLARLNGPPKSLKSFVMLDICGCVGSGVPSWHGRPVTSVKVLYVVAEGATGITDRVRAWEAVNGRRMTGVDWYPRPVQLGDEDEVRLLIRFVKRGEFGLVVLDTQARCTLGVSENDATEMGAVVDALGVVQEATGATCWLVHHTPDADPMKGRGSNAVLGGVDAEFAVKRDRKTDTVTLLNTAQKDAAEAAPVTLTYTVRGGVAGARTAGRRRGARAERDRSAEDRARGHGGVRGAGRFAHRSGSRVRVEGRARQSAEGDRRAHEQGAGREGAGGQPLPPGGSWMAHRQHGRPVVHRRLHVKMAKIIIKDRSRTQTEGYERRPVSLFVSLDRIPVTGSYPKSVSLLTSTYPLRIPDGTS